MSLLNPQHNPQIADREVTVEVPLPPVLVCLSNLTFKGAGSGSPYIIKANEAFTISVDVEFSGGTLTDLLMYIGMAIDVTYAIEGIGDAPEVNLSAPTVTTMAGTKKYTITYSAPSPAAVGLKPGFYEAAGLLSVNSPAASGLGPVAFGYIADVVFQVYA